MTIEITDTNSENILEHLSLKNNIMLKKRTYTGGADETVVRIIIRELWTEI
jgi:hypothetical protein